MGLEPLISNYYGWVLNKPVSRCSSINRYNEINTWCTPRWLKSVHVHISREILVLNKGLPFLYSSSYVGMGLHGCCLTGVYWSTKGHELWDILQDLNLNELLGFGFIQYLQLLACGGHLTLNILFDSFNFWSI